MPEGKWTREEVLSLNPSDIGRGLTDGEIRNIFEVLGAGWIYQGEPDPSKPHAVLASEKCSNGYFNCRKVLCHPNLCGILAVQLVSLLKQLGIGRVDWVVGSAYSAITWSYEVAKALGACHGFVEKDPTDPKQKRMLWKEEIPEGSCVLQAEELITTLGTTEEVRRAITETNRSISFLPVVGALVHRPAAAKELNAGKVVALLNTVIQTWEPQDCPYCKVGSPRVKPKANWARLVGRT